MHAEGMSNPSPHTSTTSSGGSASRGSDSAKPAGRHQPSEATRQERQRAEILTAIHQNRTSHALGLAFEHVDEFGIDQLVVQMLTSAVAGRRDRALSVEFDAFLELRDNMDRPPTNEKEPDPRVPRRPVNREALASDQAYGSPGGGQI
jgi:hypothetical protein